MDKSVEEKDFVEIIKEVSEKEKIYNAMTKKELVDILITKELLDKSLEPEEHGINLWYYASDDTGVKYLTNEEPHNYYMVDDDKSLYMSEGEVNIRVPKCMEGLFPEIRCEDGPVKVSVSVEY